jgi:hypothetical protein
MRFVMECVNCGNRVESPEGRDPKLLEEAIEVVDEMELVCRHCEGALAFRTEGGVVPSLEGVGPGGECSAR